VLHGSDERTALVTGGSRGIRRAIVHRLASVGHPVAAEIRQQGGRARAEHLELEDVDGIAALFDRIGDEPPVGVLAANAAASAFTPIDRFSPADLERSWATSTRSFVLLAQHASRAVRGAGGGRIVAFLCSQDAGYITGHVLVVDGGLSVVAPPFPASEPA
jgi:NAD(P)-dependent dehydrogenase (short-subunit alcohol dehydrogenase family)